MFDVVERKLGGDVVGLILKYLEIKDIWGPDRLNPGPRVQRLFLKHVHGWKTAAKSRYSQDIIVDLYGFPGNPPMFPKYPTHVFEEAVMAKADVFARRVLSETMWQLHDFEVDHMIKVSIKCDCDGVLGMLANIYQKMNGNDYLQAFPDEYVELAIENHSLACVKWLMDEAEAVDEARCCDRNAFLIEKCVNNHVWKEDEILSLPGRMTSHLHRVTNNSMLMRIVKACGERNFQRLSWYLIGKMQSPKLFTQHWKFRS